MSVVARQYDVNANLVFTRRNRYGEASNAAPGPQLVPVIPNTALDPTLVRRLLRCPRCRT